MDGAVSGWRRGSRFIKRIEVVVTRWLDNRAKAKQDQLEGEKEERLDVESEMAAFIKMCNALKTGQQIILHDRIKYLGRGYIIKGEIAFEDRDDLVVMHGIYHDALGGNGALDHLLADMLELPLKR